MNARSLTRVNLERISRDVLFYLTDYDEMIDSPEIELLEKGRIACRLLNQARAHRLEHRDERRLAGLLRDINRLAERYQAFPKLRVSAKKSVESDWEPMCEHPTYGFNELAGIIMLQFVRGIFDLIAAGMLDRLRRCDVCRKWIIARQKNQRLCGAKKCRNWDYHSNPKVRRKRNADRRRKRKEEAAEAARYRTGKLSVRNRKIGSSRKGRK